MSTATATPHKISTAEFLEMDLGEGTYELIRGEIVEMPPPDYEHGYVCANSVMLLLGFGKRTGHGHAASNDSCVVIDEFNVRGADVAYYSEARWPSSEVGKGPAPVPPDLVVEVVSPSDRPSMVQEKVAAYPRAGVLMVWVLYPKQRMLVIYRLNDAPPHVLSESDFVEGLEGLPGFRCQVAEFFR